jgi:Fur family ferric uptake transcriptional regulator
MQKDMIIEKLKETGCRITKQRLNIIDIILEQECSCCKEIYFKASQIDDRIGTATVYRMINTLEKIGAISRKNMYKIAYPQDCSMQEACTVVLDDDTEYHLSAAKWNAVIKAGLTAYGYCKNQNVVSVTIKECECDKESCEEEKKNCRYKISGWQ